MTYTCPNETHIPTNTLLSIQMHQNSLVIMECLEMRLTSFMTGRGEKPLFQNKV